ncbi:DUF4153 domain-containing protein [Fusibacter paucivorans]|uniref:DUF4153 domain-containing protein n=1 Tax=Fusibacter paucivorans TaxID=76009 RepID=A0ABS5PT97_9FIRM|nr:DUF4153 domain-containing protein [Fusibacter paucivorans]MBS7527571.1 DUF4153 domain-containing protein [Fusibacter paucivorans]
MSKIKQWFQFFKANLAKGFKRFPVTIGFAVAFVVIAIYFSHASEKAPYIDKVMMALAIGVPLSGVMKMLEEQFAFHKWLDVAVAVSFVAVYGYLIPLNPDDVFMRQYTALSAALYSLFFIVPYLKHSVSFSQYLFYNISKFFLTVLYAFILFAGSSAVYFTVNVLFELQLPEVVYMDLMMISFGIFGPMHFLGHLPKSEQRELPYAMLFERLFTWIVLPLIMIYTVILHAYFIKILLTRTFPEGMIGNLVVWYGLISVVTLFFLNEIRSKQQWLAKVTKYYPIGMIAPLCMLFAAAWMRIDLYGLTLSRYLLVVAGLFEIIAVVLIFFRRERANVPLGIIAVLMILLSFYGPISGDSLARRQQNERLRSKIEMLGALDTNGNVNVNNLDVLSQNEISLTATYLADTYGVDSLYLAEENETAEAFENRTGIDLRTYRYQVPDKETYFSHYDESLMSKVMLDGADYLLKVTSYDSLKIELEAIDINVNVEKAASSDVIEVRFESSNGAVSERVDLTAWVKSMIALESFEDEREITLGDAQYAIKWILYNVNGYRTAETNAAPDESGLKTNDLASHQQEMIIEYFEGYLRIDKID